MQFMKYMLMKFIIGPGCLVPLGNVLDVYKRQVTEPYKRWEFDMENSNMKGHWIGLFTSKDNKTEIDFTEYVTVKKFFMKPFVKSYLKKQQAQFISDLKKAAL